MKSEIPGEYIFQETSFVKNFTQTRSPMRGRENLQVESQVSPGSMTNRGTKKEKKGKRTRKITSETTLKKPQVDVPQADRDGGP